MNIEPKEVTQDRVKIELRINEKQTDSRLIGILKKLEISISSEDGEDYKRYLTEKEIEDLKIQEIVTISFSRLKSNTKYKINTLAIAKKGSVEEEVGTKQNLEEIITLKFSAEVQIKNQFVTRRYDRF